jgi:hypothetical protein
MLNLILKVSILKVALEIAVGISMLAWAICFMIFTVQRKKRTAFWMEMGMWATIAIFALIPNFSGYLCDGSAGAIMFGVSAVIMILTKAVIAPLMRKDI